MTADSAIERHAVRMLFILYYCRSGNGKYVQLALSLPDTEDAYLESETKLQKFDFWIRYPDYFATALLYQCSCGVFDEQETEEIKRVVRQIMYDEEPVLRHIPMRRYLRGAHEPLDGITSFLSSRNLAYKRYTGMRNKTTRYYITKKGLAAVNDILRDCPEATWYAERCKILNRFFGHLSGSAIREIQYLEEEYENTPLKQNISRITPVVEKRFEEIFQEPL